MIKYKIIARINFETKDFYVLTNKSHNKYFLRILEDESLIYPTLDEYNKLNQIYSEGLVGDLCFLFTLKNKNEQPKKRNFIR